MNRFKILCFAAAIISAAAGCSTTHAPAPEPCLPVPTSDQLAWQDMDMYAFIHYSTNTYTDKEWGFGDEDISLFNPTRLDARQWASTCRQAGMKGIILTAKHHSGFCLWPSAYTDYSVKNCPWKDGNGDIVGDLAKACAEEGLKFAVYLSPWDRNHPDYGTPEYITYFRNQLRELLTSYGDIFEVWFDGANGGDGYYGGANETRRIDARTYYDWPETYRMIRELQPHAVIWNDGGDRGDLRWCGTEAGYIGATNWSMLHPEGPVPMDTLQHGTEQGEVWCPGETNTSIRPGWFYHATEDSKVKSVARLMETYYKSVGRNSTLLLNFPVNREGLISPVDSATGVAFAEMIKKVFADDFAEKANVKASSTRGNDPIYGAGCTTDGDKSTYWATDDSITTGWIELQWPDTVTFNRIVLEEPISLGQRVRKFSLAYMDHSGQWININDVLADSTDGYALTTIGHRRIICSPDITTRHLRVNIDDSRACPLISKIGVYKAPAIGGNDTAADMPSLEFKPYINAAGNIMIMLDKPQLVSQLGYLPPQKSREGTVTRYILEGRDSTDKWIELSRGEFSNIVNNPIRQTITFPAKKLTALRIIPVTLHSGRIASYESLDLK